MHNFLLLYDTTACLSSLARATISVSSDHQPRSPDQRSSPCCVLNSGQDVTVCTDRGLCFDDNGLLYHGGFTDSGYMSAKC